MLITSEEKSFLSPTPKPDSANLAAALGLTFDFYLELLAITTAFKPAWNHSKSSGWMLKISDGKKALCYIIPLSGCFKISLTLREAEREILLNDSTLTELHQQLSTAQKFVEGYALQFIISNKKEHAGLLKLLHALMFSRK